MAIAVQSSASTSPYNTTFGTLVKRVLNFVRYPDDPEAREQAQDGINEGIDALNSRIWTWTLTYHDFPLASGTMDYAVPKDYKRSSSLMVMDSSYNPKSRIRGYDHKTFELYFPDAVTGSQAVLAYTVYDNLGNRTLSLNSAPSSSYVSSYPYARHRYYRTVPKLTSDGDAVLAPSEVERFLVWSGREVVAATYRKDIFDKCRSNRMETFERLVIDDNERYFQDWESERL